MTYYNIYDNCRFFDLTINGSVIVTNHAVPFPYGIATVCSELNIVSGGYDFIAINIGGGASSTTCTAPIGTGSSANGDVIIVTFYNITHALLEEIIYTLADGVDEYICPRIIISTHRKLLETGSYKLLETGYFRNLES